MSGTKISLASGLIFGVLNFWLLATIIKSLIGKEDVHVKPLKVGVLFFLKMTLLFVIIGLIVRKGYVTPFTFLEGFTASLVVGISWLILTHKDGEKAHASL